MPGFYDIKAAATEAGALGCSLSGSGPSLFALASSLAVAHEAGAAMQRAFARHSDVGSDLFVSLVGRAGARVVTGVVICISTRGVAPAVSFREALFSGLAPDGGLYVPQRCRCSTRRSGPPRGGDDGRDRHRDAGAAHRRRDSGRRAEGTATEAFDFPVPIVRLDDACRWSSCSTGRPLPSRTSAPACSRG